jgi:NADH-quinone oxidoreductase subunit G
MLELEIDGKKLEVPEGSTIMDATNKLGTYVPHFCYHKKLSIAANCRMCLVQVEKAPKPLPACATPVTAGMKVFTHSVPAVDAQKGVMEFLLINHPLDCPICDQGGECQLQDLAVGYGGSASRYTEPKRVVFNKNLGPLIATDMTRCIHCTRCVRFGQEIAGIMELGMVGRGEHAEILAFVGRTVDSELSGNVIDLCPVGALTSKPFRYSARTWELWRRKSVSPHCGLGSNLIVQIKQNRVMRVLPLENEEINECWLSDKDRYAYEGLNSDKRLTKPMLKRDGRWAETDWQTALEFVAGELKRVEKSHGAAAIGALATPHSTLEELYLLQRLARGIGSDNVDFRLRQSDFSADGKTQGAPWLGMKIADINALDRVLVAGSFLRKDHPLIAQRLRQAIKRRTQLNILHATDDDLMMPVANKAIVAPQAIAGMLLEIAKSAAEQKSVAVPVIALDATVSEAAKKIAASLVSGKNAGILLGNLAQQVDSAAQAHAAAQALASVLGARFGFLGEAANSVGGYLAGAIPGAGGLNARGMLEQPRKAYLLFNTELEYDCQHPALAIHAVDQAELVVAFTVFGDRVADYANVMLPIAPFTETSGTFVNTEGRAQSFNGVVRPLGDTRPGWKVLRVLGNLLGLDGFEFDSSEAVRDAVLAGGIGGKLNNAVGEIKMTPAGSAGNGQNLHRIADVPIHFGDALVRHAEALQATRDAQTPRAWMTSAQMRAAGVEAGGKVRLRQASAEAVLEAAIDDRLPAQCIRVAAGHPATAGLGAMFGAITVEKA